MKKITLWFILVLCIGVAGYAVFSYAVLTPGTTVAPAMKATYQEHKATILLHVFCSAIALVTGPFQFFASIRKRRGIHRKIGCVYFTAVFVGGLAGLVMSFIAYGGLVSKIGFGSLAVLWLYTAFMALLAIRRKFYVQHEVWAIRCFALTFAAVTLRLYLGAFFASGLSFDAFYPSLSWLCWVPNILFVELVIFRKSTELNQSA
jgi:Predicted membrane protein (DUF2306)